MSAVRSPPRSTAWDRAAARSSPSRMPQPVASPSTTSAVGVEVAGDEPLGGDGFADLPDEDTGGGGDLEGGGRGGVPLGRVLGRGGGEVLLGRHDLGEDRAGEYAQTLRVGEREQAGFPAPRSSTGGPVGEDRSGP